MRAARLQLILSVVRDQLHGSRVDQANDQQQAVLGIAAFQEDWTPA